MDVAVPVGGVAVAQDQLDARPDPISVMPVAVDLDEPPAVVHRKLLRSGLGVPRLGEGLFYRLVLVLLFAADDPAG